MNLIKCNNGHYYDAEKFPTCPHCAEVGGMSVTIPADDTELGTTVMDTSNVYTTTHANTEPTEDAYENPPTDIQKTVGYFEEDMGLEPVVGWLVCVEGNHFGEDFRLTSGKNFIGRNKASNNVVLDGDATVSREAQAIVIYEPKGNIYLIQPGSAKSLSYLNDEVVLESKRIEPNDIITVGATKLMFIPCCSENFKWSDCKKESE
jgi:hypothetical protein